MKPGSYAKRKHTFNDYILRKNENEMVENRSKDSKNVQIVALWHLKKNFIRDHKDYKVIMEKLKKFID